MLMPVLQSTQSDLLPNRLLWIKPYYVGIVNCIHYPKATAPLFLKYSLTEDSERDGGGDDDYDNCVIIVANGDISY